MFDNIKAVICHHHLYAWVKVLNAMSHNLDQNLDKKTRLKNFSEKFLSQDNELPFWERLVMKLYFWLKEISLSEERGFGLDASNVTVEKFPLVVAPVKSLKLKRTYAEEE